MSPAEAQASLLTIADDRRRIADEIRRASRWYSPACGVVVAGMLLAPASPPAAFPLLMALGTLSLAALATTYRLRARMWPRTENPVQVLAMVLVVAIVVVGMALTWAAWHVWAAPALGVTVAAAIGVVAGALSAAHDRASADALGRA